MIRDRLHRETKQERGGDYRDLKQITASQATENTREVMELNYV